MLNTNNVAANSNFSLHIFTKRAYVYTQAATTNKLVKVVITDWTEETASFTTHSLSVTGQNKLLQRRRRQHLRRLV
jgi:hypothetical protein